VTSLLVFCNQGIQGQFLSTLEIWNCRYCPLPVNESMNGRTVLNESLDYCNLNAKEERLHLANYYRTPSTPSRMFSTLAVLSWRSVLSIAYGNAISVDKRKSFSSDVCILILPSLSLVPFIGGVRIGVPVGLVFRFWCRRSVWCSSNCTLWTGAFGLSRMTFSAVAAA